MKKRSLAEAQSRKAKIPPEIETLPLSRLVNLVLQLDLCGPDASELRVFEMAYGDPKTAKDMYKIACCTADDTVVRAFCVGYLKRAVKEAIAQAKNPS